MEFGRSEHIKLFDLSRTLVNAINGGQSRKVPAGIWHLCCRISQGPPSSFMTGQLCVRFESVSIKKEGGRYYGKL
jgi:hypothetical protein